MGGTGRTGGTGRREEHRKNTKGQGGGPPPARDAFHHLLDGANADVLRQLVERLTAKRPDLRREALKFLMGRVPDLPSTSRSAARAELALSLWAGAEPGLRKMKTYFITDEKTVRQTLELLTQLQKHLRDRGAPVPVETRRIILDKAVSHMASRVFLAEDALLDVAYAACHDESDLRHMAELFLATGSHTLLNEAIGIYRHTLGDQDAYLKLRLKNMETGYEYFDLATFYWEELKDRARAVETARQGLALGNGGQQELRGFLAQRAKEAGNRAEYVDLLFAQLVDDGTLEGYMAFKELCTPEEWAAYEPRLMAELDGFDRVAQVEIHILRKEYDEAVALLPKAIGPLDGQEGVLHAAAKLEAHRPQKLLAFYQSLLGRLDTAASREEYQRRARFLARIRHMWVDVLKVPEAWTGFARRILASIRRLHACEEEFAAIIPGWPEEVSGAAGHTAAGQGGPGDTLAGPGVAAAKVPAVAPSLQQLELPLSSRNGSRPDGQTRTGQQE